MPERVPERLHSQLLWVFALQALIASLLLALGLAYGGSYLRDRMLRDRMEAESAHMWAAIEREPQASLHAGAGIEAWLLPAHGLPAGLRDLAPGFHSIEGDNSYAFVSERGGRRLVLTMQSRAADRIVLYNTLLALLLGVTGIVAIAWLGYRSCKAAVAPVAQLAEDLSHWDPAAPAVHAFDRIGSGQAVAEVEQLRTSLTAVAGRMHEYVEREHDFTRGASHELRTPLTVVRVATDLLGQESALSDRGQRSLGRIGNAVREMGELIDVFLMLARHPDVPLERDDIDLAAIVHEQVTLAQPLLKGKPVRMEIVEHAQPQVQAPPRVPGVLIAQLVRNACEHTDAGRIEVLVEDDRIEVGDTGIGMDAATLARAFQPFFRGESPGVAGRGLGLHLARRLGERLGWTVELRSAPGVGTTATVRFRP